MRSALLRSIFHCPKLQRNITNYFLTLATDNWKEICRTRRHTNRVFCTCVWLVGLYNIYHIAQCFSTFLSTIHTYLWARISSTQYNQKLLHKTKMKELTAFLLKFNLTMTWLLLKVSDNFRPVSGTTFCSKTHRIRLSSVSSRRQL